MQVNTISFKTSKILCEGTDKEIHEREGTDRVEVVYYS